MTELAAITLGAKIRQARKDAGYRNAESFAVTLDVSHRTIQRWEANEGEPSIARLRQIAAVTDKPLSYFFDSEVPDEEEAA